MRSSGTPIGPGRDTAHDAVPALSTKDAFQPGPLFDALPCAAMIVDAQGGILYANSALHELLEYAPGGLAGTPLTALQPGAIAEEVLAHLRRVLGGLDANVPLPAEYCTRPGRRMMVKAASRVILVDGVRLVLSSVMPAGEDAAATAFAHRQWQLRLFSNLSSDYFYRTGMDDTDSPLEIWPIARFTAITGYTREGVLEAGGWPNIIHPEDLPGIAHPDQQRPEDGPLRSEYRIITASGDIRWLRDSYQVIEDPEAGVAMLFGAVSDVTGEHEALEALQSSEAQLRRILDSVSQSFALLDRELRVVAANKKMYYDFERGYGKPLEIGRSFAEQLPLEWATVLEINAHATLAGEVRREELLWELPNGDPEWAAVQLNPIVEHGEVVGINMCVEGIHRRKVAEIALRESESQLRGIFDTVSQGFMLLDTDLIVTAANRKLLEDFERSFGRKLAVGDCLLEMLPPDFLALLEENLQPVLDGEGRTQELLFPLVDAEPEWNEVQLNPIVENGVVTGVSVCIDEIHRRKVAEIALRESETQLRRIFENVSQGFALLDCDLRVEVANHQMFQEFEAIFGHGLIIGERFHDRLPETWRQAFLEDTEAALAGAHRYREYHFPESRTEAKWFEMAMNPIVENGEIVGISLCADEIERRKMAEDALQQAYLAMEETVVERTRELQTAYDQLRESEERLRLIAERASDVIWHIDGQNKVLYMSPAFERVFGWPVSTLEERGIDIAFRPEKRAEMTAAMDAHLEYWRAKGQYPPTFTHEVEYCHRDGHAFFAEVNMDFAFPDFARWLKYGREEDYPHILGVSRDLTERKRQEAERQQLEQQVLHSQKLESLGVLAGGIAHDFNNLLVGIMGYASLADMELPTGNPVKMYVKQIEVASQRAADLTQQMLAYSGRGQFIVQPVGISELTREMVHLLATVVSKKAMVEYELAENLPTVRADATQLRQVVMNLITNASEALEENTGSIRLSTGLCKVTARELRALMAAENAKPGSFVFLEVSDTGCGMDAETLARIFDPFYTTKFTGRGLGLGAVHGIVRGHHGAIRVDSTVGRGTTIRVLLPVSGEPIPPSEMPLPGADGRARGETVLIVDDEESVREFARHSLELGGYRVVLARNGREAVDYMEREADRVHGILLDLTMPEMGGAEALEILRDRWPAVPVVLSSGHAEQQALDDTGGIAPFLQKPYHPDLLRRMMRQALDQGGAGKALQ